jgi:DNA-binding GntR family transcriptional regulator
MEKTTRLYQQAAPLRQQVVKALRREILDDVVHPGERLLENTLCERYGVSRTVVREALRQLESEHLITLLPNKGPIVSILSSHDITALYEVRARLEGLAGELFAERATDEDVVALTSLMGDMEDTYLKGDLESRGRAKDEFYRILLKGGYNDVLAEDLRRLHTRIGIFRHYAFVDEERVVISMEELRRIVDAAARQRDPERARRACEDHIRLAGQLAIMEYTRRVPSEGPTGI